MLINKINKQSIIRNWDSLTMTSIKHKFYVTLCLSILIIIFILSSTLIADAQLNASQILKYIDEHMFPNNFEATMTMVNYDKPNHIDKKYTYNLKRKKDIGSFLLVTDPQQERGSKILMKQNNMWMYIPGNARTIRLSKSEDFIGSTFSNGDLMDVDMVNNYNAEIIQKTGVPDSFILMKLTAKRNDVTYARIEMYVWKKTYIPAMQEFYSKSGQLLKKMVFSQITQIGGRQRPTKMVMESVFEPGRKTVVDLITLEEKNSLSDSLFNEARLIE